MLILSSQMMSLDWRDSGPCMILPQNLLVPHKEILPAGQNSTTDFYERCCEHLQWLWLQLWLQKATSWNWTSTFSCFESGSAISGKIQRYWFELPVSQYPYLTNGDNKSMLKITRIIVRNKGNSSGRWISRPHSTVCNHQSNIVVFISFRIYIVFCFIKHFFLFLSLFQP